MCPIDLPMAPPMPYDDFSDDPLLPPRNEEYGAPPLTTIGQPYDPFSSFPVPPGSGGPQNRHVYLVQGPEKPEKPSRRRVDPGPSTGDKNGPHDSSADEDGGIVYKAMYRRNGKYGCDWQVSSSEPIASPKELAPPPIKACFEVITEYETLKSKGRRIDEFSSDGSGSEDDTASSVSEDSPDRNVIFTGKFKIPPPEMQVTSLKGETRIVTTSRSIIKALQHVTEAFYPMPHLLGETVTILEPYQLIIQHWDALHAYRNEYNPFRVRQDAWCDRDKDSYKHLGLLLDFVRSSTMPSVIAERARHARGRATWAMLWLLFRPGTDVLAREVATPHDGHVRNGCRFGRGFVVHSIEGGGEGVYAMPYRINARCLDSDGTSVTWLERCFTIPHFSGEVEVAELELVPADWPGLASTGDGIAPVEHLRRRGKMFFELLQPQCRHHSGRRLQTPWAPLEGLVMIDLRTYLKDMSKALPSSQPGPRKKRPVPHATSPSSVLPVCNCTTCQADPHKGKQENNPQVCLDSYDKINLESAVELTDHQYFLMPNRAYGYYFKTKTWEVLAVESLSAPQFKADMIDTLVMEPSRIKLLKALSKNFTRSEAEVAAAQEAPSDSTAASSPASKVQTMKKKPNLNHNPVWSADFVDGKGSSLIFLLHGRPGVGKTYTAECIAEHTKRPLMTLTCADIGTYSETVDKNLKRHFERAQEWGAILLIDEADVFMEKVRRHCRCHCQLRCQRSY